MLVLIDHLLFNKYVLIRLNKRYCICVPYRVNMTRILATVLNVEGGMILVHIYNRKGSVWISVES